MGTDSLQLRKTWLPFVHMGGRYYRAMPQQLFRPEALLITQADKSTRLTQFLVGNSPMLIAEGGLDASLFDPSIAGDYRLLSEIVESDPEKWEPFGLPWVCRTAEVGNTLTVELDKCGPNTSVAAWGSTAP